MVFVNENCISCGVCEAMAPMIFKVEDGTSKVIKQPETPEDKDSYQQAKSACPVEAIQD